MKYLFEKIEEEMSPLESISKQIEFIFADFRWKGLKAEEFEKIIKKEEPRINLISVEKKETKVVVCFGNEELKSEIRRLF